MKIANITLIAAFVGPLVLAVPATAQTPPPPAQQAPPQAPAAQQAAPQTSAAQPAPAAAQPVFPAGAKIAMINVQRVGLESAEGKAANAKAQALNEKKVAELNEKNKALQATQQKLAGVATLTEDQRAQIQREVDKLNLEIQRFTQDAQAEVEELQVQLQTDFQRTLMPIIELVAVAKGIQIVFAHDAGIVWSDPGLDLTNEVIARFDAAMGAGKPKAPDPPPTFSERLQLR